MNIVTKNRYLAIIGDDVEFKDISGQFLRQC